MSNLSWDTDGCATVSDTVCEFINAAGLVSASQTQSVVITIDSDVLLVAAFELLESSLDGLHATWLTHLLGGEVAVETSSVPVTWDWLGVERDLGTEFLSNTVEEETSEP